MNRRLFFGIVICPLIGLVVSCDNGSMESFVSVRSDRAKLLAPFESYASISDVEEILKSRGLVWQVIEKESTIAKGERRPPFNVYIIRVGNFTHLGFEGKLRLEFFNNRLMATWFYPTNLSAYRKVIEEHYPELRAKQASMVGKNTGIEFGTDHEKHDYIAWEDVRLRDEFSLWIKRYS